MKSRNDRLAGKRSDRRRPVQDETDQTAGTGGRGGGSGRTGRGSSSGRGEQDPAEAPLPRRGSS